MDFSISEIKLIVGLGNIGKEYSYTRHNAGFLFLEHLALKLPTTGIWQQKDKLQSTLISTPSLKLAKPTTMMNNSGISVVKLANYFDISPQQILVAHDDLDMDIGEFKVQFGKGPKLHNGVNSIEQRLSTKNFWRLRIGIDNRGEKGNNLIPGRRYALERFKQDELTTLESTFEEISNQLLPLELSNIST